MRNSPLDLCVERWNGRAFPGVVVAVRHRGQIVIRKAYGKRHLHPHAAPMTFDTRFDLASMTKPLATGAIALAMIDAGEMELETSLGEIVPETHPASGEVTVFNLLTHTGGFPPVPMLQRFFPDPDRLDPEAAERHLLQIPPVKPVGTQAVYSCTGFELLGVALQRITGSSMGRLFDELVAGPLSVPAAGFRPQTDDAPIAATEFCRWRKRWIQGAVHDESAYCLDGNAGNAGLFASIDAVMALTMIFNLSDTGERSILTAETITAATRSYTDGMEQRRGLALQINTPTAAGGPSLSPDSFGHTGFTGTHFWTDPTRDLTVVALSSRLQYGRDATQEAIREFRHQLHRAVLEELGIP